MESYQLKPSLDVRLMICQEFWYVTQGLPLGYQPGSVCPDVNMKANECDDVRMLEVGPHSEFSCQCLRED